MVEHVSGKETYAGRHRVIEFWDRMTTGTRESSGWFLWCGRSRWLPLLNFESHSPSTLTRI